MADSWNDRLETLQKTLDDAIKFFSERVEDRLSQQGANGSGENSTTTKPVSLENSVTPPPKPDPITSPEDTPPKINPLAPQTPKITQKDQNPNECSHSIPCLRLLRSHHQHHHTAPSRNCSFVQQPPPPCTDHPSHRSKHYQRQHKRATSYGASLHSSLCRPRRQHRQTDRPPKKRMKHNFSTLSLRTRTLSRGEE